ncbi:hypothetical protein D3C76_1432250 [compost metagenome]
MQFEIGLASLQLGDVRHERRDADAAGDEDVQAGGGVQGEQVGRRRDLQRVTHLDVPVQVKRAAAGGVLQAYGDAVVAAVRRVAGQRIGIAHLATVQRQVHLHMTAGGESRQGAAAGFQGEFAHPLGEHVGRAHPDLQRGAHGWTPAQGWSGLLHTPR